MAYGKKTNKRPTHTHLVLEALVHWPKDFASIRDLMEATGSAYNQVNAALFHLRNRHAVDVVIENDGKAWWFATPGSDERTHTVDERTPEERPRSRRVSRVRKVVGPT